MNKQRELAFRMIKYATKDTSIKARLPEAYKKFYRATFETTPKPLHFIPEEGKWKKNPETGVVLPVQNVPIRTKFPPEMNNVLSGGEMVVQGFVKKDPRKRRVPRFWVPHLQRSVVYSEILNMHISVIVTQRLLSLIHEHKGFDNYLLENAECDIKSNIGLKIKKRILNALLEKKLPYDDKRNQELYEKYKKYIIPREELEWYGLTFTEACRKQQDIEEAARVNVSPLKYKFRAELLDELRNTKPVDLPTEEPKEGWISKIKKPFRRD